MTQILDDCVKNENNLRPKFYKDSSIINLSIDCSDEMINAQNFPLLSLVDCAKAKRCLDTDCMDVELSVVNDEKHVSYSVNSCIGFVKSNNIKFIISNKLDNKIIPNSMPFNVNSKLGTVAKCSNDCSKYIDNLEIESMEFESIKSNKKINAVVEKLEVKEKDVVIPKVELSDIYGTFPTDFSPLVLMRIMTGSKPRNAIKSKFLVLIKTPYTMCLQNDKSIVQLTNDDINRLKKYCSWLSDSIILCFLRWISLQSNQIAVVDSLSYLTETWNEPNQIYVINKWGDKASMTIYIN